MLTGLLLHPFGSTQVKQRLVILVEHCRCCNVFSPVIFSELSGSPIRKTKGLNNNFVVQPLYTYNFVHLYYSS